MDAHISLRDIGYRLASSLGIPEIDSQRHMELHTRSNKLYARPEECVECWVAKFQKDTWEAMKVELTDILCENVINAAKAGRPTLESLQPYVEGLFMVSRLVSYHEQS